MDSYLERAELRARVGEWLWRVGALLAIVSAVCFLGACASANPTALFAAGQDASGSTTTEVEPSPTTTAFGRCWNEPYEKVSAWTSWRGGDYVPCEEQHTTYTYTVQELPARHAAAFSRALSASQSAQAEMSAREDIRAVGSRICQTELEFLVPTRGDQYSMLTMFTLLPSDAEWQAGARWVRCDIGLLAPPTPESEPRFAALPAHITDLSLSVERYPRQYELCLSASTTAEQDVPHADGAVQVPCNTDDVWHFYASVPLGYAPESAFPGSDAVASAAKAACASAAAELDDANADTDATQWWFYPGEAGWDDGRRTASCWMYLI